MVLSLGLKPAARAKVFQSGYCSLQLGCLAGSMNSKIKNTALEVLVRNWYLCYSMSSPTTHLRFHPPGQQQCLREAWVPERCETSLELQICCWRRQMMPSYRLSIFSCYLLLASVWLSVFFAGISLLCKWCTSPYATCYSKPSVLWMGSPDPTGHCQSLEMIKRDYDKQQRPIKDVRTFRTQVSPLGTRGYSFFLIVKEQQGHVLLHDWQEQGSRNSPQCLKKESRSGMVNKVIQESSHHPASPQCWGRSEVKPESQVSESWSEQGR